MHATICQTELVTTPLIQHICQGNIITFVMIPVAA